MTNINNQNNVNTGKTEFAKNKAAKNVEDTLNLEASSVNAAEKSSHEYSAIIGRSQVNFGYKGDNLQKDIELFVKSPKNIENSNKFFNLAYARQKKLDNKDAYEYAALLAREYYNEFHNI